MYNYQAFEGIICLVGLGVGREFGEWENFVRNATRR
jgi:hypothetical protein